MSKPIPVLETHLDEDGKWVVEITPVSSSEDIDTLASLDELEVTTRTVLIQGEAKELQVYTDGSSSWIRYEAAFA